LKCWNPISTYETTEMHILGSALTQLSLLTIFFHILVINWIIIILIPLRQYPTRVLDTELAEGHGYYVLSLIFSDPQLWVWLWFIWMSSVLLDQQLLSWNGPLSLGVSKVIACNPFKFRSDKCQNFQPLEILLFLTTCDIHSDEVFEGISFRSFKFLWNF
jgi:hypothetical protein